MPDVQISRFPFLQRKKRPVRPAGPVTALEWEGNQLRVVLGEPAGLGYRLDRLLVLPLALQSEAMNDPVAIGKAISQALAQAKFKIPGPVIMGIPRGVVVLRTLVLPALKDLKALASMVHFQMAKDLPFRSEDAVIDFKVGQLVPIPAGAEQSDADQQEILAAAVRREIVDFYLRTAESADLQLAGLGLLSHANARCLEAAKVTQPGETLALVSVRAGEIAVDVIGNDTLLFSRNVLVKLYAENEEPPHEPLVNPDASGENTNGKARNFEELATIEVVRTLHGYGGAQGSQPIQRVYLAGATGLENAIARLLGEKLTVPCAVLEIAPAFSLSAELAPLALGSVGPIGLLISAFDPSGLPFNFLSPKQQAVPRDLRKIRILGAAALAALLFVCLAGVRAKLIKQRTATIAELTQQADGLEKQRPLFKKMIQQAKTVDDWNKSGQDWLVHYAYLSAILPPSEELYVSSLAVGGNGVIRLNVQARSGEIFAKLEKQLRIAHYDVKPIAITPASDRFGYDFRSTIEMTVNPKFKVDLTTLKVPARPLDDASLDPAALKKGGKG